MGELKNKVKCEKGYYIFKLGEMLKQTNTTRYALSKATNMDRKLINRYIDGDLTRFDAKVLARLCDYFNCGIDEIIEYKPNSK